VTASLRQLQSAFQRHLLEGDGAFAAAVHAGHGIGVEARLHIYHHAYRARLVDALRDTYGHPAAYLGAPRFDEVAPAFVESHPSRHASLNDYGAEFPAWLGERQAHAPEIGELAQLDWTLRRAFDGPDAQPLDLAALARVEPAAWEHIGLAMVPTLARLSLACNTLALWCALDRDEAPPAPEALPQRTELLVWRRGHEPHFRSLDEAERTLLDALLRGHSFAQACTALAARLPEADTALQAGRLLRRWVDEDLLAAIVEPTPT
jgi:hypothetical protein